MNRLLKGVLALVATLGLVVGVPVLLVTWGRLDVLGSIDWALVWSTPDDGSVLLLLVSLIGWVAWLAIVASFAVELVAVSRRRPAIRLPGLSWAQPLAASLVVAIAGIAVSGVVTPAAAAPTEATAPEGSRPVTTAAPVASAAEAVTTSTADTPASLVHTVVRGDDLWSLASHYYGDGSRWREIRDANPGLDAAAHLQPGQHLIVPDGVRTKGAGTPIVVSEGDTLTSLAATHLGDADRWRELLHANRDRITDPDLIQPGWVLRVQGAQAHVQTTDADAKAAAPRPAPSTPATATPVPATDVPSAAPVAPDAPFDPRSTPHLDHDADVSVAADAPASGLPATGTGALGSSRGTGVPVTSSAPILSASAANPVLTEASEGESDPARALVGGLTSLLALSLAAGLAVRRRGQLLHRGLGERILHASPEAQRFESALARVATRAEDVPLTPTTVILGLDGDDLVLHDVGAARLTWLACPDADVRPQVVAALVTGLVGATWSCRVSTQVVGAQLGWARSFDNPLSRVWTATDDGLAALERSTAGRRLELTRQGEAIVAEWDPEVYLFAEPLGADQANRLVRAVSGIEVGVSAVVAAFAHPAGSPADRGEIVTYDGDSASIGGRVFTPQLLDAPARHALVELHDVSGSLDTTPAPWWSDDDDLPPNLAVLPRRSTPLSEEPVDPFAASPDPVIRLLGPIELHGARGPAPTRAVKQCVEYAAWIHTHPGRRAVHMMRSLLVAEGTRRSNMSRLRSWLGDDPFGEPYLPDAYSGVIELHPGITSDWERLQTLVHGGVNRASSDALADALQLVRGAPLADAAPGQWHWAEEMRTDMASTIRDIGAVLADRALAAGDLDVARWAASRALVAAPEDEVLMCARIRTEHLAGNRGEVDRLVLHLTRQARTLGVDLSDETIEVLQDVVEGRPRARRA